MEFKEILTISVTIAIAVLGWLISLFLQRKNIKDQHRIQVRYDIYKEFVKLRRETQDSINKLGGHASSPFILMSSSMIPFQVGLKKEYKDQWLPYSEQECLFEGEQKWNSFVKKLYDSYFDFSNNFLNVMYLTEDWASPLKRLLPVKQIFNEEVQKLKKNIQTNLSVLQSYPQTHGHDWRSWKQEEANLIIQNIGNDSMSVGMYLSDFMVLVHNELLSSYFGHKRPTRKTLDKKYKVLTKKGIIENVDWKLFKKTESMTNDLITYAKNELSNHSDQNGYISPEYKNFLTSVSSGVCSNCTTPILVMNMEKSENIFCYQYACGHSFKGISIQETITIRDLIKIKKFDQLLGKIRTIVQGWKQSGDKRIKDGVDYYMDVNKENNEYHQIVKDYKTGEILHEEHEPLTAHKIVKK